MSKALEDIASERRRQVEAEGWTPEHDDEHTDGSLASAAAAYAWVSIADKADRAVIDQFGREGLTWGRKAIWPQSWDLRWFKPKDRRRDLIKAGALIVAEIERLDRAALTDARADALEEAAKVAEKDNTPAYGPHTDTIEHLAETQRRNIATAIRALANRQTGEAK